MNLTKKKIKILNIILFKNFICNNSKICRNTFVKSLFLNTMQFILPFYNENSRSRDFKYEIVNVGKLIINKNCKFYYKN